MQTAFGPALHFFGPALHFVEFAGVLVAVRDSGPGID